jgi:hypothetical protein
MRCYFRARLVLAQRCHDQLHGARSDCRGAVCSIAVRHGRQRPTAVLLHACDAWVCTKRFHHRVDCTRGGSPHLVFLHAFRDVTQRSAICTLHLRRSAVPAHRPNQRLARSGGASLEPGILSLGHVTHRLATNPLQFGIRAACGHSSQHGFECASNSHLVRDARLSSD